MFLKDGNGESRNTTANLSFSDNKMKEEPFNKMQMIRNKMVDARRAMDRDQAKLSKFKEDPRDVFNDMEITLASEVPNSHVQDHEEVVIVGADVEALYPNLLDIEVANICFNAIMKSKICFRNINYKKALQYLAICMHKTDQRTSPLWRALPRRTSGGGGEARSDLISG